MNSELSVYVLALQRVALYDDGNPCKRSGKFSLPLAPAYIARKKGEAEASPPFYVSLPVESNEGLVSLLQAVLLQQVPNSMRQLPVLSNWNQKPKY